MGDNYWTPGRLKKLFERSGGKGWEPPCGAKDPNITELVRRGYLKIVDGRCGFERMKDAMVIWTDAGRSALSLPDAGWRPTHRHLKRGTSYQLVTYGRLQTEKPIGDDEVLVIYRAEDGRVWARPVDEFNDGRFEPLPAPPQGTAT